MRRPIHYYLEGRTALPWHGDLLEWAEKMQATRRVALDQVDEVTISTVFLGIDHQWLEGPPLLFETAIFSGEDGAGDLERCSTYAEAEAMHRQAVAKVQSEHAQRESIAREVLSRVAERSP